MADDTLLGWVARRVAAAKPIRVVAAGLSRSGSTLQFLALRLLLTHAIGSHGRPGLTLQTAHGHAVDRDMQACLDSRYCLLKVHEFLPGVLARVDAVFVTHRDPRDAL